jgi:hypothetical protein
MSGSPIDLMCQQVVELVTEYLCHALMAEDQVRFEQHLLTCPACTTYLGQMRTILDLAGSLGRTPPSPEVQQALLHLFHRWQQK